MSYDKDKIKESLTEQDIVKILTDLGDGSHKKDNQGNLMFRTGCHNMNGGSYKLYYYTDSYSFYCYSHCNQSYDIYSLVMKMKRLRGTVLDFPQSISYVASITNKHYRSNFNIYRDNPYIIDDWDFINSYKINAKPNIDLPVYDKTVLEVFRYLPHRSWLEEGISWKTMKKFDVSYYIKHDRIVIPHFDIDGDLVGIRGRATKQEEVDDGKKYMPLIVGGQLYNHPTAFNLYALNLNKDNIRKYKKVVIFESEKSCMLSEEIYSEDSFAVAVGGSNISGVQRDILLDLNIESVIIAFDKEYEDSQSKRADIYSRKIKKLAENFLNYCNVYVLWDTTGLLDEQDSPIDKGKEVFEKLFDEKIEIVREYKEEVYGDEIDIDC